MAVLSHVSPLNLLRSRTCYTSSSEERVSLTHRTTATNMRRRNGLLIVQLPNVDRWYSAIPGWTDCGVSRFCSVPPATLHYSVSHQASTASFHSLANSLFSMTVPFDTTYTELPHALFNRSYIKQHKQNRCTINNRLSLSI